MIDTAEIPTIEAGTIVNGRYEIEEFLGEGAFAVVYAAKQLNIDRRVAVKLLKLIGQDREQRKAMVDRFLVEARAAAAIEHPGVVTVHDTGVFEQTGQPFMVMEFLEGQDLEEVLTTIGPIEPPRAVQLMLGTLEALAEAHAIGIVHKDLKPSNLILHTGRSGRETLRIVDFGIARLSERRGQKLTDSHQLFGTPQYLAPEYIESQQAGPPLDVYQCALILVEMLTGKPVVDETSPYKCMSTHVSGVLDIPAEYRQGEFGALLQQALDVEPEKRFANAQAFHAALSQIDPAAIGSATSAPPTAAPNGDVAEPAGLADTRAMVAPTRKPIGLLGIAAVVAVAILLGIGVAAFALKVLDAEDDAVPPTETVETPSAEAAKTTNAAEQLPSDEPEVAATDEGNPVVEDTDEEAAESADNLEQPEETVELPDKEMAESDAAATAPERTRVKRAKPVATVRTRPPSGKSKPTETKEPPKPTTPKVRFADEPKEDKPAATPRFAD